MVGGEAIVAAYPAAAPAAISPFAIVPPLPTADHISGLLEERCPTAAAQSVFADQR